MATTNSNDAQAAALNDDVLLMELQRRLKMPRGAEPKKELVAIALLLARDPAIDPSAGGFWGPANVGC